ncbi:MAG: NusG domain II-containing protein [Ruminococcus sp.]|nr:NusG domain II-containing protein [Ruminococcus sp.]MDE7226470.1 NusG domain II-containing protein [Ruminococcus sp.]
MNKKIKICLFTAVFLFIGAVVATVCILRPSSGNIVEVVRDNEVLYTFNLETAGNQTVRIEYPDGGYNIIEIADNSIKISDADCPDQTCVRTGTLKYSGMPVVCLPHHLIIRYIDGKEN